MVSLERRLRRLQVGRLPMGCCCCLSCRGPAMELHGADSFEYLEDSGGSKDLVEAVCNVKSGFQSEGLRIEEKRVEASLEYIVRMGMAF